MIFLINSCFHEPYLITEMAQLQYDYKLPVAHWHCYENVYADVEN